MVIYRGSTEHLELNIKNIEISDIAELWFTVSQNRTVKIFKTLSELSEVNGKLYANLSQEDTLSLMAKVFAYVQLRILLNNGEAIPTTRKRIYIMDVDKDGVISTGGEI